MTMALLSDFPLSGMSADFISKMSLMFIWVSGTQMSSPSSYFKSQGLSQALEM